MAVGFTEESWRDRSNPAQGAASGVGQISDNKVPPRPIHLIQPDRYYSFYPFTVDSVQINVRVRIDAFGAVTSAESLNSGNALLSRLSTIAVRAARGSTFVPARAGNRNVPSTAVLSYRFMREE